MVAFELSQSFEMPDVLQAGRPDTRPIRRAIDLFRHHSSKDEWDKLCQYTVEALSRSTSQKDDRKIMSIQAMLLGDWDNIKSTEGNKRIQEGRYKVWVVWVQTVAPHWYKNLLRCHLEMWSLQVPEGPDQNNIRKLYQTFAVDCGSLLWGWDNHNNAESRIAELQNLILQIETPQQSWIMEERHVFQYNYEVSFISRLTEVPPTPVNSTNTPYAAEPPSRREARNAIEEAAYDYVLNLFPNIDNADVTAWPIEPCWVLLRADGQIQRLLMVFRYNQAFSRIPRVVTAFGGMNVMGLVNEEECDSSHPLFAGELQFAGTRRVVLFNLKGANTTLVRTWVSRSVPAKEDIVKEFYLANGDGMRKVRPDVYAKAKSLKK